MSDTQTAVAVTNRAELARKVDTIVQGAMSLFAQAGSFESELAVAQAIGDMRTALTPEVMKPVMELMNSDIGFRTDRDPAKGETPYTAEEVKDAIIEAKLRGFHCVGNEFNIISSRFYATRNGLRRKCEQYPGVTDLKVDVAIPRLVAESVAHVSTESRWKKGGIADSIKCEISVRVNKGQGADAVVGKAERKLYKRILERLSGVITPDAEVGEEPAMRPAQSNFVPASFGARAVADKPDNEPIAGQDKPEQSQAPEQPAQPQEQATAQQAPRTPQVEIAEHFFAAGLTFADFKRWAYETNFIPGKQLANITGFDTMPSAIAARLIAARTGMLSAIKSSGKKA